MYVPELGAAPGRQRHNPVCDLFREPLLGCKWQILGPPAGLEMFPFPGARRFLFSSIYDRPTDDGGHHFARELRAIERRVERLRSSLGCLIGPTLLRVKHGYVGVTS